MQEFGQDVLDSLLANVRRRLFMRGVVYWGVRAGLVVLPVATLAIAAEQRWGIGPGTLIVLSVAAAVILAFSFFKAWRDLGEKVHSALELDHRAALKDRISSACEFLKQGPLDEARETQVRDAVRWARRIDPKRVLGIQWPRYSAFLPAVGLALLLSFLVPPLQLPRLASAAADEIKQAQLEQLRQLQDQLQSKEETTPELQEVLKKLEQVKKQFERGEVSERDLMLQLARLDENLKSKTKELGVENLEGEMNVIVPHLMSAPAAMATAEAIKEDKLDKAEEELQKLADKVKENKLSKEQKKELTTALGVCASKLNNKSATSFAGDFAKASESLESSDGDGFTSACKSMGSKLALLKKARTLKSVCQNLGNCKMCLGQCNSKELGYKIGPKQMSKSKGGLKAGTGASGDPFGDPNRLADSYKQAVRISGQAGEGPVESETEVSEGQMSASQVNLKEIHAKFTASAEEVIEKEDIPLSHRFHVKRYFQSIRPQE